MASLHCSFKNILRLKLFVLLLLMLFIFPFIDGVSCDLPLTELENKSIVIVDDVLNTGSTLIYAVQYFLQIPVNQIKTAVIVNRNHKKFPIKADFKGISLSTSTNEHVSVILDGSKSGIYLR